MKMNKIDTYPDGSVTLRPAQQTVPLSYWRRIRYAWRALRTGYTDPGLSLEIIDNYFEVQSGEPGIEVHN